MSTGPENVTSTATSGPPEFLQGPLNQAVGAASDRFSGAPNPNQLNTNASGLVNSTLQGNFLDPNTNPYLQSTFNRAADLTRGRLDTEFAGAGRNLGGALPARSDELQTLASNIFGGNYQAERDRQVNAVGQAQGLDPLNQFLNQLTSVLPGAGGTTESINPVFKTGLF